MFKFYLYYYHNRIKEFMFVYINLSCEIYNYFYYDYLFRLKTHFIYFSTKIITTAMLFVNLYFKVILSLCFHLYLLLKDRHRSL